MYAHRIRTWIIYRYENFREKEDIFEILRNAEEILQQETQQGSSIVHFEVEEQVQEGREDIPLRETRRDKLPQYPRRRRKCIFRKEL